MRNRTNCIYLACGDCVYSETPEMHESSDVDEGEEDAEEDEAGAEDVAQEKEGSQGHAACWRRLKVSGIKNKKQVDIKHAT